MSGIFISWASSDSAVVMPLIERLKGLGFASPDNPDPQIPTLWEYRHEMAAGDDISDEVMGAIGAAGIAVLCLSDQALTSHKWIQREIDWVVMARKQGTLHDIIPVKVGPLTPEGLKPISDQITQDKFLFDYSNGAEDDLVRLSADILKKLGREEPKLLPVAVIAMTDAEAKMLFENWKEKVKQGEDEPLWKICEAVGMQGPPEVFNVLTERYGPRPEDLMPFGQASLAGIVHASVAEANERRVAMQMRPVFPRWLHSELVGPAGPAREAARDLWSSRDSLLIIDSLSIYHDQVVSRLSRVPPADDPSRVATVCLPPYTRRTGSLDDVLQGWVQRDIGLPIEPFFKEWSKASADRMVTFDMSTSLSLRSWLRRKIGTIPKDDPPLKKNAKAMGPSTFNATPGGVMTKK